METIELRQGEEYIKLSQALKKAGITDSGAEAKMLVRSGEILVNGKKEDRPGRKLVSGDRIILENKEYRIQ